MHKKLRISIITLFITYSSLAQTLQPITLQAAEDTFLGKNYQLLAQRYRVDADKALVQQARLWSNPSFNATWGFGTTSKVQPFYGGNGGQTAYEVDQLITLAGKRNKQVQLARLNAAASQSAFYELMRTLRLQLRGSYYQLYFLQETEKVLLEQLSNLQKIVDAYTEADKKGSVAHADVVRLRALLVGISNDYADLKQQELAAQLNLQQLLGSNRQFAPRVDTEELVRYNMAGYTPAALTDTALANRPDLRMAQQQLQQAQVNYSLQKAMAVPDLHVGAAYDKNGSYAPNFIGLTMGIDLPFWNRNQGNIRAAGNEVKAQEQSLAQGNNIVVTEVQQSLEKIRLADQQYRALDFRSFSEEYDRLIAEVALNFRKGNISLLQFIDYFNSYSDNVKHINKLLLDRITAYEELNYVTGTELFLK
ncbi:TolC family protein [Chitinophaga japonensis]|uniref:Cobalt-zinc-cadmium efflux system outer membrane protein n=1 Tax=Chitinophaga japonensis TaxID=104662 RepID=A0A562SY46_CHIJA|nr:TolC family protein [Chitinophaga japonensis]TWI86242.1 cobalt-zinc-cadmium efflux system outer membrane protein [Chitinophaga japonensis]